MPLARVLFYVATLGAFALIARALLIAPLPLWLAGASLALYVALVLAGVFVLRLGMFVDVLSHGEREARGVALTFDDGPHPTHTPAILNRLDEAGVKATFFVIGRKVEAHPEIAREITRRGHAIGVHGFTHDRLFSLRSPAFVRADIERALATIEAATGERTSLFRPPIGYTSPGMAKVIDALDLTVVGWSARGLDGLPGARSERVAERIVPRLEDGAIVLLHDAAERDDFTPASLAALPRILDAMAARNLEGVRVDEWLDEG